MARGLAVGISPPDQAPSRRAPPHRELYPSPSPTTHTRSPAARAAAASATARASNSQAGWRNRFAEACGYTAARACQSSWRNCCHSVSSTTASAAGSHTPSPPEPTRASTPRSAAICSGAHLGIKDRQLRSFFQQVAADADRRGLAGVVGVCFVDAVGRRPAACRSPCRTGCSPPGGQCGAAARC